MITVGDKLNLKTFKSTKYHVVNQAGRPFKIYLEDIPAKLIRLDGKVLDIKKDDESYRLLGEPIAPTIEMVDALLIKTDTENFLFFGEGIHVMSVENEFNLLKYGMEQYLIENKKKALPKKTQKKIELPKVNVPQIEISKPNVDLSKMKKQVTGIAKKNNVIDAVFVEKKKHK
ncbi:MAG: hypothetical protein HUJ53_10835 [Holdemanella sp.]|nr:hypothetical protein [Holdemanella sp.]